MNEFNLIDKKELAPLHELNEGIVSARPPLAAPARSCAHDGSPVHFHSSSTECHRTTTNIKYWPPRSSVSSSRLPLCLARPRSQPPPLPRNIASSHLLVRLASFLLCLFPSSCSPPLCFVPSSSPPFFCLALPARAARSARPACNQSLFCAAWLEETWARIGLSGGVPAEEWLSAVVAVAATLSKGRGRHWRGCAPAGVSAEWRLSVGVRATQDDGYSPRACDCPSLTGRDRSYRTPSQGSRSLPAATLCGRHVNPCPLLNRSARTQSLCARRAT